jgi:hypothetical protein
MFGYEERWYQGGTWRLWNLNDLTIVASGTIGTLYLEIDYAPPSGQGAHGSATATITAVNDSGAFYNELISRWGSPNLSATFSCNQPPVLVDGGSRDPITWWAEFAIVTMLTPAPSETICSAPIVGDLNDDCKVDLSDFALMAANWLQCNLVPSSACWQ